MSGAQALTEQAIFDAGAILPGAAASGAGQDTVTARRYRHPVLEQTVVRLVGQTLGQAEDLSMEFLGFEAAAEPVAVGHARRQALGFPAWALINDPANGRHALAMVKDMERLARLAKSKPGNAKDGYDTLAAKLGGAAPQFLPTFWEQAGRAFLATDNQRMAGTCFMLARSAEQVHGLPIDEERLREVHLEFAFGGALTAKVLTEFARGVVARQPARTAYELVRTLAIRRVAGGLAPQASLAADLQKLAKAAGLDPAEEARFVAGQLITLPAMTRSPMSVWKGYAKALTQLAAREPAVRARLLEILPEQPRNSTDNTDEWLDVLEATGTLELLVAPQPGELSAGRWLERIAARRQRQEARRSARLLSLVERMTPRLVAEARPLELWGESWWHPELDLLDLCVAGGVPMVIGEIPYGLDVHEWASDDQPGARDLRALAADPRLRPAMHQGVQRAVHHLRSGTDLGQPPLPPEVITAAFGAAGVAEVLADVLSELSAQAVGGTVLSLDDALTGLVPLWSRTGASFAPQAFQALLEIDVAAALGHSLRTGLIAEYAWPAYAEAAAQKRKMRLGFGWPELVVNDNQSLHVLRPGGSVTEHVIQYPPAGSDFAPNDYDTDCHPVGDDLFVRWVTEDFFPAGYWLSDPGEVVPTSSPGWHASTGPSDSPPLPLRLPGGGVTRGSHPWLPGNTDPPKDIYAVASDGTHFWRCEFGSTGGEADRWFWREFDPATGTPGRVSLPAFFARPLPDGARLIAEMCELRPAPAQFAASPLGCSDGLVGWRVANLPDGSQVGEAVDGRAVTWRPRRFFAIPSSPPPDMVGVLVMPGDPGALLPLTRSESFYRWHPYMVWTPDGRFPLQRFDIEESVLPPPAWWHALTPRDPRGSEALRAITDDAARRLMEVGDEDEVEEGKPLDDAVDANLSTVLPELTSPELRAAVAAEVSRAVVLRRRLDEVADLLTAGAPVEQAVSDSALRKAWAGLLESPRTYHYGYGEPGDRQEIMTQIRAIRVVVQTGQTFDDVPTISPVWTDLLAGPGALALRAACPATDDDDRSALVGLLTGLREAGLVEGGDRLRIVTFAAEYRPDPPVQFLTWDDQVTVVLAGDAKRHFASQRYHYTAVQISESGTFEPPENTTVEHEIRVGSAWRGSDRIEAFLGLLAANGPAPWRPDAVDRLTAATGMTGPEAALLLAGLPGLDRQEANFLTAQQRAAIGINMNQARVARDSLSRIDPASRVALLDAAMPRDPAALWEHGPDVEALAQQWLRLHGVRVAVPEELLAEAARVLPKAHAAEVIHAIAGPAPGSWLTTDGRTTVRGWGRLETTTPDGSGTAFDEDYGYSAAVALAWLAYRLPWGDPIRAALPAALDLVRQRLRNPDLLMSSDTHPPDLLLDLGGTVVAEDYDADTKMVHVKPCELSGPDDPAIGLADEQTSFALRLLLSPELTRAVATPEGAQGQPHDPSVSVPDLVEQAAKHLGVPQDAAVYYLQLLALPDPTDRNVLSWNGWRAAELKAAQAALTEAGLVLAAKRERAGRPVFLPGGWIAAKSPAHPMEAWKAQFYLVHHGLTLVTVPVPELFRTAWQRITSGDTPRYHDLKEAR